jgi:hypothetical protein
MSNFRERFCFISARIETPADRPQRRPRTPRTAPGHSEAHYHGANTRGLRLLGVSIAKQERRGALAAGRGVCYKYEAA